MSIKLNKIEVINFIKKNTKQFCEFEKVYIFGSILRKDKYSNDIDILLLYSDFSFDIQRNINIIKAFIEQKTFYPVDITALSFEEEKEIGFIDKLDKRYVCIK
ncbi:MAG: nucleotidyltransferase domain-containing protein [Eggerthia catenaformis]|uniref:nucleotidyltransferase domain-containing protein n=1 Tax=Eggerthia catenaformis TaxID=31973 RepID=UPI003FA07F24